LLQSFFPYGFFSVGSWVKTGKSHAIMIVITKLVLEGKRDMDSRDAGLEFEQYSSPSISLPL
jgi:hypothetical protein